MSLVARQVRADFFCVKHVLRVVVCAGEGSRKLGTSDGSGARSDAQCVEKRGSVGVAPQWFPSLSLTRSSGLPLCLFASLRRRCGRLGGPCAHRRRRPARWSSALPKNIYPQIIPLHRSRSRFCNTPVQSSEEGVFRDSKKTLRHDERQCATLRDSTEMSRDTLQCPGTLPGLSRDIAGQSGTLERARKETSRETRRFRVDFASIGNDLQEKGT